MITIKVSGIEATKSILAKVPPGVARNLIREFSQVVYDKAQTGADKHTKTGALFQSLYSRAVPGGREIGHDPQRAPHAVFVHFGSKPHKIKPRNKKILRWPTSNGFAFAKEVNHPGYKGDPWLYNAASDALSDFDSIVQTALKGI